MYFRILQKTLQKELFQGKTIILYGARQVGKTTLVKQLIKDNNVSSKYIDGDIIDNQQGLQTQNPQALKQFIGDYKLVVIDEAQRIRNIGINLKILHDHFPDMQIIATGSSSFDLANKIVEPLTGRAYDYMLFGLSGSEIALRQDYSFLHTRLKNILRFGLYPEVFDKNIEQSQQLLRTITSNYLYKDILALEDIKKSDQLLKLLQILAFQIGSQISYNSISRKLGLSVMTVQKYIDLLEKTFVIFRLTSFSRNLRKELNRSVKIYFWDIGIRNTLIQNFNTLDVRNDIGALWENFCIVERIKNNRYHNRYPMSAFWRSYNHAEIDYIEEYDGNLYAYECKYSPRKKIQCPKLFAEGYPKSAFHVITQDNYFDFITS